MSVNEEYGRIYQYEWMSTDERDGLVKMDEYG